MQRNINLIDLVKRLRRSCLVSDRRATGGEGKGGRQVGYEKDARSNGCAARARSMQLRGQRRAGRRASCAPEGALRGAQPRESVQEKRRSGYGKPPAKWPLVSAFLTNERARSP